MLELTISLSSADEAALLAVFRESLQQTFGDYGLGSALASFQGKNLKSCG